MTRQVSLSEEAYRKLSYMKGNMSFSEVVLKLSLAANPKRDFTKFAGMLKSESAELNRFKKQVEKDRSRNTRQGE